MPTKQNARRNQKTTTGVQNTAHFPTAVQAVNRLALAACIPMQARATVAPDAQKHHGLGRPVLEKAQKPRPSRTAAFFMSVGCARHTWLPILAGRVGTRASVCRFLFPVDQPCTVCHPCLVAGAAGLKPVEKEPLVANTLTPKGRTAPAFLPTTGKHTHTFDPVALRSESVNALEMANFYAKRHNYAGAKRKTVQALAALRQLAAFERVEVAA